jgi:hypothetical protein
MNRLSRTGDPLGASVARPAQDDGPGVGSLRRHGERGGDAAVDGK